MNILVDEHRKLVLDLLANKVEFILVGGYAFIYHGYGRITGDMDIWLSLTTSIRKNLFHY